MDCFLIRYNRRTNRALHPSLLAIVPQLKPESPSPFPTSPKVERLSLFFHPAVASPFFGRGIFPSPSIPRPPYPHVRTTDHKERNMPTAAIQARQYAYGQ